MDCCSLTSGLEKVKYFLGKQMGLRNTDFDSKDQGDRNTGNFISITWEKKDTEINMLFWKQKNLSREISNRVFVQHTWAWREPHFGKESLAEFCPQRRCSDSCSRVTGRIEGCNKSCLHRWHQPPSACSQMPFWYVQGAGPAPKPCRVGSPDFCQHTDW